MKLALRQTQRVVMTPLLQQAIQLLQLSTLELEQVVRKELEENPLLEEVPVEAAETQSATAPGTAEVAPAPAPSEPVSKETSSVDGERADELPFDLSAAIFDEPDERTPVSMEEREELPFENLAGRSSGTWTRTGTSGPSSPRSPRGRAARSRPWRRRCGWCRDSTLGAWRPGACRSACCSR